MKTRFRSSAVLNVQSLFLALCLLTASCAPEPVPDTPEVILQEGEDAAGQIPENPTQPQETMTISIKAGGKTFKADIQDSETGRAFLAKLPFTLDMSELNGNEKYCYGVTLPRADKYFGSIAAGDLMLYSGQCIVLFYGPAGGYSYTRIGKLQSTDGLAAALGDGSVSVRFEKE